MTFLVTGATGDVGCHVVTLLLEAGVPVRATTRDPARAGLPAGVHVRAVDLAQPESFAGALSGVRKVFLFPEPSRIDGVAEALKAADVEHVSLLSSIAATFADAADGNPLVERHVVIERALVASGLPWTFVRPGAFAANTLPWARTIRSEGAVDLASPEATFAPIHEYDIAEVAVRALLEDGHAGAAYSITGSESLTQRRQVELIGEAIGRRIEVRELSREEALAGMTGWVPAELAAILLDYQAGSVGVPAGTTDTFEQVTGKPPRAFAQWAIDHRPDFS